MHNHIGERIKVLRKEKKITLATMADQTGLSIGFLSKLEHDQTSPTIANLHKICEVLGLTLNDVLSNDIPHQKVAVVRASERQLVFESEDRDLQYTAVTEGDTILKTTAITLKPGKTYPSMPHSHDELGIVVSGILEVVADGQNYLLQAGDSIYIRAETMHSIRCASAEPCVSYWTKTAISH